MVQIPLRGRYGEGLFALIEDDDYARVKDYKWFLSTKRPSGHQYIRTRIGKNDVRLHRYVMNATRSEMIDHINGNTLDNRKSNLRRCTNQQNQWNSTKHKDKKTIQGLSIPKGIRFDATRPHRPWVGRISYNGKRLMTKGYPTMEEALQEYITLVNKYYGEYARIVL